MPPPYPDILLIVWDDVGHEDTTRTATPNLDALVAQGVRFNRGYAHAWCAPTRDALYRACYDTFYRGEGCDGLVHPKALQPGVDHLAPAYFKALGYSTAIFGKWHLGTSSYVWQQEPQRHGFDVWRAGIATSVSSCGGTDYEYWLRAENGASFFEGGYADSEIVGSFSAWWATTPSPRFAVVAFQLAHSPYHVSPFTECPASGSGNKAQYLSMICGLDKLTGEIVSTAGPNAWKVLIGDNGTPGCHPVTLGCAANVCPTGVDPFKAKITTYERGVRVPFVISAPGIASPGRTSEALVHVTDIFPTIAEALGPPVPYPIDGISFASVLADPMAQGPRGWVYCRSPGGPTFTTYLDRAVIERRWKLRDANGTKFLFDLQTDPLENVNLYGIPTYVAEQQRLEATLAGLP